MRYAQMHRYHFCLQCALLVAIASPIPVNATIVIVIIVFVVSLVDLVHAILHPATQRKDPAFYTRPALPTCIISPVSLSSERKTGHAAPSAFARVSSSFVPRILNLLSSGLMVPKRGNSVA